jgi:hypothetical protein
MKLDAQAQRCFRTKYHNVPPLRTSVHFYYRLFKGTGSVLHKSGAVPPYVSDDSFEHKCESLLIVQVGQRSLELCIRFHGQTTPPAVPSGVGSRAVE